MILGAKILGHAAQAAQAAAERQAEQLAFEVIGPLVVRAGEFLRSAAIGAAELHAAMGAAIDQNVDLTIHAAHRDDLAGAQLAAGKVPRVGDLGVETDVKPVRALEDAFLLTREDVGVGVDPVGNARWSRRGPVPRRYRMKRAAVRRCHCYLADPLARSYQ